MSQVYWKFEIGCILRVERLAAFESINGEEHPDGKNTRIQADAKAACKAFCWQRSVEGERSNLVKSAARLIVERIPHARCGLRGFRTRQLWHTYATSGSGTASAARGTPAWEKTFNPLPSASGNIAKRSPAAPSRRTN